MTRTEAIDVLLWLVQMVIAFAIALVILPLLAPQWLLFRLPRMLKHHADRNLYYPVVQLRRRLKGEELWQQHDWTSLGIMPEEGTPAYERMRAAMYSGEELFPETAETAEKEP